MWIPSLQTHYDKKKSFHLYQVLQGCGSLGDLYASFFTSKHMCSFVSQEVIIV